MWKKKNRIEHVWRENGLLRDVLEGRMLGKRVRGRPRMRMIDDLTEGGMYDWMKRRPERREEWKVWVPGACIRAHYSWWWWWWWWWSWWWQLKIVFSILYCQMSETRKCENWLKTIMMMMMIIHYNILVYSSCCTRCIINIPDSKV